MFTKDNISHYTMAIEDRVSRAVARDVKTRWGEINVRLVHFTMDLIEDLRQTSTYRYDSHATIQVIILGTPFFMDVDYFNMVCAKSFTLKNHADIWEFCDTIYRNVITGIHDFLDCDLALDRSEALDDGSQMASFIDRFLANLSYGNPYQFSMQNQWVAELKEKRNELLARFEQEELEVLLPLQSLLEEVSGRKTKRL